MSHNPYFTGNSFAILLTTIKTKDYQCHNPYFTGNSFAILTSTKIGIFSSSSQSLFYWKLFCNGLWNKTWRWIHHVTILILLETLLQYVKKVYDYIDYTPSQSLFYWKLFCNKNTFFDESHLSSHNPYFTGNSFAIYSPIDR